MVRKDMKLMRHGIFVCLKIVDGAFQAIIRGCRQWMEWGKCSVMVEDRYMVEVRVRAFVFLYVIRRAMRSVTNLRGG